MSLKDDETWDAHPAVHSFQSLKESKDKFLRLKDAHKRESTSLTVRLLNEISNSVKKEKLRPSKSLDFTTTHFMKEDTTDQAEIDVVISGGGLKGYYMTGAAHVLLGELSKKRLKIARMAGASAGAWASMFMLSGVTTETWMETYHACFERPNRTIHDIYEEILPQMYECLPQNAYQLCSGRLFISITVLTWTGFKNKIISEFSSNEDLLGACFASSTIPFITEKGGFRRYRGQIVCDGGITNNTPVFSDGVRRQLVFRLFDVEYPSRMLINPVDTCIDTLVLRGAILMARFLQGERTDSIAFLEHKETKSNLARPPNYYTRIIIAPIAIGSIMIFRGTGMSDISKAVKALLGDNKSPRVDIPFSEAAKYFDPAPVSYVAGYVVAAVTDLLRSMNLLI